MTLLSLCCFALLTVVLSRLAADSATKFRPLILVGAGCGFFLFFLKSALPLLQEFQAMTEQHGMNDAFSLLFKALGVAVILSVASSLCRDFGEEGVAQKLELCGKVTLLSLALPVMKKILEAVGELGR